MLTDRAGDNRDQELSIRALADKHHVHRRTVQKSLTHEFAQRDARRAADKVKRKDLGAPPDP